MRIAVIGASGGRWLFRWQVGPRQSGCCVRRAGRTLRAIQTQGLQVDDLEDHFTVYPQATGDPMDRHAVVHFCWAHKQS